MIHPDLPLHALSIRQPWAAAILAGKDIENRSRRTNIRGRICIHVGAWNAADYEARGFIADQGIALPANPDLRRNGIIGTVEIVDCVDHSDSPWFFGPYGYVLRDPQPCEFIYVPGMLGFFDWRKRL